MSFQKDGMTPKTRRAGCKECGGPCVSKWSRKYCSRQCSFEAMAKRGAAVQQAKRKACARCKALFELRSRGRVLAVKYCSHTCQRAALRERADARAERHPKKCKQCGKAFIPKQWSGGSWATFCSKACLRERWQARATVQCAECGRDVQQMKAYARRAKRHYCSVVCRGKHNRGANHVMFRSETILNPKRRGMVSVWRTRAAEARARDGDKCRRCGVEHLHGAKAFPVDHVVPWRTFEDKKEADDLSNLVTLCPKCHAWKTSTVERRYLKGDVLDFLQFCRDVGVLNVLAEMKL